MLSESVARDGGGGDGEDAAEEDMMLEGFVAGDGEFLVSVEQRYKLA